MSKPFTIASSLVPAQNEALGAVSGCRLVPLEEQPWLVPADADALFTYQTQWRNAPSVAPEGWPFNLRWIQVASAGVDTFPEWIHAVPLVTRGRGVQSPAIAEYVIGAIYAHEKRFWDERIRGAGQWRHKILGSVAGKTVGIAGFGAIGADVARTAMVLHMDVVALSRTNRFEMDGVQAAADMDDLMRRSDHLVLAMPLTADTHGIINAERLQSAKPGLHLINVARGQLLDNEALIHALDSGLLSAATLDVTAPEPLPDGHPLYTHPKVRLTPHVSGMTEDNEERLSRLLVANLADFLAGRELSGVVPPGRGY